MNKDNIPHYVFYIFLSIALLWLFSKSCGTIETEVIRNDTVISVKTTIDTVFFPSSPIVVKIPVYKHDTIWINDSTFHNVYNSEFKDSLIEAKIRTEVDGILISNELTYRPLFPKYINRTDSIFRDIYIPVNYKPSSYLFGGLFVKGSKQSFDFGPSLGYAHGKGMIVQYGYHILNNEHTIGISKRINF